MRISVAGKVNSGKSSFINSFYSLICEESKTEWKPIATVSARRETFHATKYILNGKSDNYDYDNELILNKNLHKSKCGESKIMEFNIQPKCFISTIIDFPGIDDSNDKRDILSVISKNMGDVMIFVLDANRPLIEKSELEYFEKIKKISGNIKGHRLIIVVNKYDDEDEDKEEMFDDIEHEPKFKWCSYACFKKIGFQLKQVEKVKISSICDIDGLYGYLRGDNKIVKNFKFAEETGDKNKNIEKLDIPKFKANRLDALIIAHYVLKTKARIICIDIMTQKIYACRKSVIIEKYVDKLKEKDKKRKIVAGVSGAMIGGILLVLAAPIIAPMFAVAGLSGAAAVSSGLATLGGGALAVGGLGMAGGTAILAGAGGLIGGSLIGITVSKEDAKFYEKAFRKHIAGQRYMDTIMYENGIKLFEGEFIGDKFKKGIVRDRRGVVLYAGDFLDGLPN